MKNKPYSNTPLSLIMNRIVSTNINFYYTDGNGSHIAKFICNFRDDEYETLKEELYQHNVYMIVAEDVYQFGVYLFNTDIEYEVDERNVIYQ